MCIVVLLLWLMLLSSLFARALATTLSHRNNELVRPTSATRNACETNFVVRFHVASIKETSAVTTGQCST